MYGEIHGDMEHGQPAVYFANTAEYAKWTRRSRRVWVMKLKRKGFEGRCIICIDLVYCVSMALVGHHSVRRCVR